MKRRKFISRTAVAATGLLVTPLGVAGAGFTAGLPVSARALLADFRLLLLDAPYPEVAKQLASVSSVLSTQEGKLTYLATSGERITLFRKKGRLTARVG